MKLLMLLILLISISFSNSAAPTESPILTLSPTPSTTPTSTPTPTPTPTSTSTPNNNNNNSNEKPNEKSDNIKFISPGINGCNFKYTNGFSEYYCGEKRVYKFSTDQDKWTTILDVYYSNNNEQFIFFYNSFDGSYEIVQSSTGLVKSSDFIKKNCSRIIQKELSGKLTCVVSHDDITEYQLSSIDGLKLIQ